MKISIVILGLMVAHIYYCETCLSFEGIIKNEKGQTVFKFRDSERRVTILNKNGFVQGWMDKKSGRFFDKRGFPAGSIKPTRPVSLNDIKKK